MLTWRQVKTKVGRRRIGKKAKWFELLENELLKNKKTREVKDEYKKKKGLQCQEKEERISADKRKKEWVFIKGKENEEALVGRIIKKGKRIVEVEKWKEKQENTREVINQQEEYVEGHKLQKEEGQNRRVALKEVHNITKYVRKKDNIPQMIFSIEALEGLKQEIEVCKAEEYKNFKGLERVELENSWEDELINQVIQNKVIRVELKERLEINREQEELVFYTDGSLGGVGEENRARMGYSVVQIDSSNNVVFSYSGRVENWFSSTRAELTACLVALLLVPSKCKVEIRTDSACGILAIESCLKNESTREWLKSKNSNILRAIKKVCESKMIYLNLTKVKGHSGDRYNDLADILAKEGIHRTEDTKIKSINSKSVKYIPEWEKVSLEAPLRTFVKRIVQVSYKAEWTWLRKKNDVWHQFRIREQNWKAFRGLLESLRKQSHNVEANHLRIFKIKCIENLLPTVEILNRRKPHLYRNKLCKRCKKEEETNEHIVKCEKAQTELEKIEKEVWKQLQEDKRKEESWNLESLKQVLFGDSGKRELQRIEWMKGILNEEIARRIKDIVGSERATIKFWCIIWNSWIELFYKEIWKKRCKDMKTWEKKEKIGYKEKYAKRKRKTKEKGRRNESTEKGISGRVDENVVTCNQSRKIAIDSIRREVKEGIVLKWI